MARKKSTPEGQDWKALLVNEQGFREVLETVVQQVLESEMDEALQAGKGERTPDRQGIAVGTTLAVW